MINIPKGTKDCLPKDSYKWQYIEDAARKVAKNFGVKEIRTPVFEHTEVFLRSVGDTTDIVNKEMYTFLDKGDRSITLKPEGTAGVARSVIENGLANGPLPLKLFYITPCFRYERPQAGRLREFHQFGVELLGSDSPSLDVETILLAKTFLDELKITGLKLHINSIGCKKCRSVYNAALREYFKENLDKMCKDCHERYEKNPLRLLDCKNEECKKISAGAPKIIDFLDEECKNHFDKVKELLDKVGVEYEIDPNIVRGLDYYSKTVFEFVSTNIGAQGTVCGGGRYDGLIEGMGGNPLPGVGFGLGLERLLLLMENCGIEIPDRNKTDLYIATMGEKEYQKAFEIAYALRQNGVAVEIDHMGRSIKAQFKFADKISAEYVAVIGETELAENSVKLKKMSDGSETQVALSGLVEYLCGKQE